MGIIINGQEPGKQKGYWIVKGWRTITMVTIYVMAFILSKPINEFIYKSTKEWTITPCTLYEFLDDYIWANIAIFIWVLSVLTILIWKNRKNRYFSAIGVSISVVLCILTLRQDNWLYANTPIPYLRYDLFFALIVIGYVLWSAIRCCRRTNQPNRSRTNKIVMTSDEITGVKISAAREAYAKMLVGELLTSDLYDQSYAVAVTGEWGSGKSLFLETVKKELGSRAIVVEFNPWNSQDGDHIVKDFFDTLSSNLSPLYGGLRKRMKKYVSFLYSLRFQLANNVILQHFPIESYDMITRKADVANALNSIKKPIVILIDDIDRLAGKEIFEVLRIIRNTGKFNNLIYIVSYDKEHVISQLSLPGIEIDADYLEKIFQIELSMPQMDVKMLEEEFKGLCRNGVNRTSKIYSTLDKLSEEDYKQIFKVFVSFRKVKRFVRQFSFNANFLMKSLFESDKIPLRDVMFLNIIQTLDFKLYHIMWVNPESLFDISIHPQTLCNYYVIKDEKEIDKSPANYFIKSLFGNIANKDSNGIQMVDAYYKYFYLCQPEKDLSKKDFNEMLKQPMSVVAQVGMRTTIRGWVLSKESKSASSIFSCFINSKPYFHTNINESEKFITALFYWLEFENRTNAKIEEVLITFLDISRYDVKIHVQLRDYVLSLLNKLLDGDQYEKMAKVLSALYISTYKDNKLLIDKTDVEVAISTNINHFLNSHEWDAVLLFKGDDNPMLRFTKAYCIKTTNNGVRKNIAIEQLIEYFSQPEKMSKNYSLVEKYIDSFKWFRVYGEKVDKSIDWKEYKDIFGDGLTNANKYLERCFRKEERQTDTAQKK